MLSNLRLAVVSAMFAGGVLFTPDAVQGQSWYTTYDQEPAQFQLSYDLLVSKGFRPISITVNQIAGGPLFQATWANDGENDWASALGLSWSEFQDFSIQQVRLGRRPLCVGSYGPYPNELYVSVWAQGDGAPWEARYRMSASELNAQLNLLGTAGYRPYWESVNDSGAQTVFTALWIRDGKGTRESHDDNDADFRLALASFRVQGCRLICSMSHASASTSNPVFGGVWVRWEQPEWDYFHDQTRAELDETVAQYSDNGYRPTFLNAYETDAGRRYTSAWEMIPRPHVWRVQGPEVPELSGFDALIRQFMIDRHIRNASLAMTKNGRLVLARGYTWAPDDWPTTGPMTRFRLASLSKTFTGVGIMKLVDSGMIAIDQPISTILDTSAWTDPRINNVTVRQLLQHWGGWDDATSMFAVLAEDFAVSAALNMPLPTTPDMIFEFMSSRHLDFDPGARYAYSNFGYFLLGRIIEAVTHQSYEDWMRDNVFAPVHAYGPRLGYSLARDSWPGESPYVDLYQRVTRCVMGPDAPEWTPIIYGGLNIHNQSSSGGWISSAVDFVRLLSAFDDLDHSPLLSRSAIELMWSRPPGLPPDATAYYTAGWWINTLGTPGTFNASNVGNFTGTSTSFERRFDGVDWVVLFNTDGAENLPSMYINPMMDSQIDATSQWPARDLFGRFTAASLMEP